MKNSGETQGQLKYNTDVNTSIWFSNTNKFLKNRINDKKLYFVLIISAFLTLLSVGRSLAA